jgi:anthranilate phosphoribosyltransferase
MIEFLTRVASRPLTEDEAADAMRVIMRGYATTAQIAGLAMAMAARGETVDEIAGMAGAAMEFVTPVPFGGDVLDTCGTGGDGLDTFNISTTSAIVAAACGVRVGKHGNRSVSSACGSADVLEELGIRVDMGPGAVADCLATTGITFMLAPVFHAAFRHARTPRRELGVRTVFNLLGPLCNPAGARYRTLGVPRADLVGPMAEVLRRLGVTRALVFHSHDGMDELSTAAPASVVELNNGRHEAYELDPAALGLPRPADGALTGGDRSVNAAIIRRILAGEHGPARDIVLLNAAAALRVSNVAEEWPAAMAIAAAAIDSGAATDVLRRWAEISWKRTEWRAPA